MPTSVKRNVLALLPRYVVQETEPSAVRKVDSHNNQADRGGDLIFRPQAEWRVWQCSQVSDYRNALSRRGSRSTDPSIRRNSESIGKPCEASTAPGSASAEAFVAKEIEPKGGRGCRHGPRRRYRGWFLFFAASGLSSAACRSCLGQPPRGQRREDHAATRRQRLRN